MQGVVFCWNGSVTTVLSELKSALSEVPTVLLDDDLLHVFEDARAGAAALEALAAQPSIVVVVGAGGSGKSTVVNAIVGSDAVSVSPIRPTTTRVTAVGASGTPPVDAAAEHVVVSGLPPGIVVVDTPPWDVAEGTVRSIMGVAALSIVVVTPARYGDEAIREALGAARSSDSFRVVANRMPQGLPLREQLEDAIAERLGVIPAAVIAEGDPVIVPGLIDDVPRDDPATARHAVLSRAVAGSSRRVAEGLTQVAREVGSLERVINTVSTPVPELPPVDESSDWTEVRDSLVSAVMSAVSSFDDAVESGHDGGLASRVRSRLPEIGSEPTTASLDAWKDDVSQRFGSNARVRFRRKSGRALVERWSWIVSIDPNAGVPRRFDSLMTDAKDSTVTVSGEMLAEILQEPVEARRAEWRAIVDSAGDYRPGVLFAAATALTGEDDAHA